MPSRRIASSTKLSPLQSRALDPFTSFDSNNINKLTIKLPIKDLSAYNTEVERLKSVFDTCLCPKLKFVQVTD